MAKSESMPARRAIAVGMTAMSISSDPAKAVVVGRGFRATVNGLNVDGEPSFAVAAETGERLRVMERGAQFALGDFIVYVENHFGERAAQIIDFEGGWSERTCAVYRWLATRIALADRRMDRLGVSHHLLVAPLAPAKQRHWLKQAAADEEERPWTVARLRQAIGEGADAPVTGYWCLVLCSDAEDQTRLQEEMEKQGRTCKAVERRKPRQQTLEEQTT